ncbi:MAG: PAS domain S-box protein, partial [Anaerolineae bacterium]|nr:PAS domain S-box protein [Anaerolineae bacterium]
MSRQISILYMEDNEGTARLLQKRLSRIGYAIEIAPNGEAGFKQCLAHPYDAIIVDYNMPGLNGLQVIQRLAAHGIIPPTIMLTGTGNEQIAVEALKLGAFDYVIKDIDGIYLDLLPTVIEQALRNQQLLEDKFRAEEALRESEERFRMLFEEAPDPYFVNDLAGNLLDCNRAVEPLLGISREELIGKNFVDMELFTPSQLEKIANILATLPKDMFTEPPELNITRPDGKEVVLVLRMIPIQTKGQTQILGIGHDITWRKQAEAQMKAHIVQLEILRQIDDELTSRLDIAYVQDMALENMMRLSGANAGSIALIYESKLQGVHSVGYPEVLNQHYSLENRSIVTRVARQLEAEWVKDVSVDPDYFAILEDTLSQISIPLVSQERLIGIVNLETNQPDCFNEEQLEFLKLIATRIAAAIDNAQLYDISQKHLVQLQKLYEQISALEQLKTDMVRIVSHDLRNPLTVATTFTSLLERSLSSSVTEKQTGYFAQINNALNRMKELTTDVLSVENIEHLARGQISTQEVNLVDLIQEILEGSRIQAARKNQTVSFFSSDSPIMIQGNKTELHQAASNLIDNAMKYTPE